MSIDQLRSEGEYKKANQHDEIRSKFRAIVTRCVSGESLEEILKDIEDESTTDAATHDVAQPDVTL